MNSNTSTTPKLIFDIGVNHGEDTHFYLAKGFHVIGVEANPILAAENRECLRPYIESGQLMIENVGIMDIPGILPFYRNLDCDHWSSFLPEYGCRNGTAFETIHINCITIIDLINKYGCPYYMKIDVEGADKTILKQLKEIDFRPPFISVEEFGIATFDYLEALGYDMFSVRTQQDKSWASPPNPPKEGVYVERTSTHRDSGLFGLEIPEWHEIKEAKKLFNRVARDEHGTWIAPPGEFFDIHATTNILLDKDRTAQ